MANGIDHVVIGVRDLEQAAADYEALGFTVTPGGEHAGGATHNALIGFADGTYLELIAFTDPERPQEHRWWSKIAAGEGLIDFALRSDGLAAEASRLRDAGLANDGPQEGGRLRPDGERVAWRNLVVENPDVSLPFLIEDVTPRELRVPAGTAANHLNGVMGVDGLTVAVDDLDKGAAIFAALLNADAETTGSAAGTGEARRLAVGPHWVELVRLGVLDAEPREALATRRGPVGLILHRFTGVGNALSPDLTHGASIRIVT